VINFVGKPGSEIHSWSPTTLKIIGRLRNFRLISVFLSLLVGLISALITLSLGLKAPPFVFFGIFVLPWLIQDVFRLFIWLIVTWPILTLFVRIPLPAGIPDLSYDRVLILLLLCVVIIEAIHSKRKLMKVSPLDILVLVYLGAQLSSRIFVLWFGGMGSPDLNGLLDIIVIPLLMYWAAKNLLVSRVHLKWFLYALVIASLLICLSGLYEQAVGKRVFFVSSRLGGWEQQYLWQDVRGMRAAGALGNPAIYGATLGMGCLAGICCLPHVKRKLTQAAIVATIGVLLYGVLASYTRSAWISVFIVLFFAQFLVNGLWKRTLPLLILGLLLLAFMWDKLPPSSVIIVRATKLETITPRLDVIRLGWERFLEKPFLGWGSGALNIFGTKQVETISHNIYLSFLVDGGLVLFLSFLAIVGSLLFKAVLIYRRMTAKNSLERNVLVAMAGIVLIYLMSGLALELRYFGYFNTLFWICAGIIDLLGTRCSSRDNSFS
jgi:O-antigen ligase